MIAYRLLHQQDFQHDDQSGAGDLPLSFHKGDKEQRGLGFANMFKSVIPAATKVASVISTIAKDETARTLAKNIVEEGTKLMKSKKGQKNLEDVKESVTKAVSGSSAKKRKRTPKKWTKSPLMSPTRPRKKKSVRSRKDGKE